jgi:hypothetical protein
MSVALHIAEGRMDSVLAVRLSPGHSPFHPVPPWWASDGGGLFGADDLSHSGGLAVWFSPPPE